MNAKGIANAIAFNTGTGSGIDFDIDNGIASVNNSGVVVVLG